MTPDLSLVFSYRNREVERVQRCLQSLENQSDKNFKVVFVDYGSTEEYKAPMEKVVRSFDFCHYQFSNTRKQFWSRSHALNTGVRLVDTPYYATTDIDLLFEPNFINEVRGRMREDAFLHGLVYFLEKEFSDYENLVKLDKSKLKLSQKGVHYGGFQLAPTKIMHELRGFDEFYRIWGLEDVDLNKRLKSKGLEELWLDESISHTWHQWHPHINDPLFSRTWYRFMEDYFFRHESIERNPAAWGEVISDEKRPLLSDTFHADRSIISHSFPQRKAQLLDYQLIDQRFEELNSGEVLELNYQNSEAHPGFLEKMRNSLAHRIKIDFKVDLDRYLQKYTDYYAACRNVQWLIIKKELQGSLADYTFEFNDGFRAQLLKA